MAVEYAENGTDAVLTLTARDPEGVTPIVWSLLADAGGVQDLGIVQAPTDSQDDVDADDIADRTLFDIKDGVLTFKKPPSYEDDSASGAEADAKNYRVVVQASDGGTTDEQLSWFKVTVTVTDEEEDGSVSWTVDHDGGGADEPKLMQFQAGAILTASVTDADGPDPLTNIRWQWYRSSSEASMGTMIDGATSATYTASDTSTSNDVGMYLRAMATYSDRRGPNKTASLVSDYPVQAARKDNSEPEFPSAAATREITEGASGRTVGAPVTATDADSDVLNYTISTNDNFSINQETGQITTKAALNFESETISHEVTVTATDSAGEASDPAVTVTITVTDVNEKPMFSEGTEGMAVDHVENADSLVVSTYTAADPEEGSVELSLSGDDADMFELTDPDPPVAGSKELSFKAKPDFEMPGDKNKDNIYEVTVVASDGEMTAMRSLTVKVIDADEMGMVELSSQDALIGVELTATLKDSDGGVPDPAKFTGVTWQWYSLTATDTELDSEAEDAVIKRAASPSYTPVAGDRGRYLKAMVTYTDRTYDEDNDDTNDDTTGLMSFMNTAVSDSTTAVRNNPANQAPKFTDGASSTFRVVEENTMALMGADGTDDADDDASTATDNVADNVGEPVTAKDADGDIPTYTLGGADKDMFRIRSDGQIEVGANANLDYEKKKRLTVTVMADDGYGASNSTSEITVTIHVTDLDEAPMIMDRDDRDAKGEQSVTYEENDDKWVLRLSATDPERVTPIVWSLLADADGDQDLGIVQAPTDSQDDVDAADIADRALFDIKDGVLTFKKPPSYEADSVSGDGDDAKNYRVVVQASDGGTTDEQLSWFKVTVTVTDEEEDGSVSWTVDHDGDGADEPKLMQFQAGAILTASVTDADGPDLLTNIRWQWYRSSSDTSMGTMIAGATEVTYITTDSGSAPDDGGDDRGKYIHVKATYSDRRGPNKTASLVSDYPVQAVRKEINTAPVFSSAAISRRITEGASGRTVGAPVTATDADSDVLNYTISTNDNFSINQETGQITTKAALNFESDTISHEVTVTATDSAGEASDPAVTVTITVTDLNEKPTFSAEPTGMAADHTEGGTDIDGDPDTDEVEPATYTATDPEGADVKLTLSGADKDMFELGTDTDTGAGATQLLSFKIEPDFEMPGDKNKDNIYEVTVVASDGEMTDMRSLTVKVTDSDEPGKVELSSQDALIGVELTATLTDSDGGVPDPATLTGVTWVWERDDDTTNDDTNADPEAVISGATSASYTPVAADRGMHLRAIATYTDRTYDEDNDDDTAVMSFMNTAVSDSTTAVRNNPANQAPKFTDGASTFRVVEENTMALMGADGTDDADDDASTATDNVADNVGEPVTAKDDADPMPTYTLGGSDADMFRVRANGQIEVSAKAMLDYEMKSSYTVTVTATDSSGDEANNSDSITVTIYVTDLDEGPIVSSGGLAVSGATSVDYEENGEDAVETYTAFGPDATQATWDLSGPDEADFRIVGGELTFRTPPDYETPADADEDNVYMVTVEANDGTSTASRDVTVTVTDVEDAVEPDLMTRYDANNNGGIDKSEMIQAITDYLFGEGDEAITKPEMIEVITLYLFAS